MLGGSNIKKILYIIIVLISIGCSGCSKHEPKEETTNVNTEHTIRELMYNMPRMVRSGMSFAIRKKDIDNIFGEADIVRTNGQYSYEIRYMEDGGKLFVFYDHIGTHINEHIGPRAYDMWTFKYIFDYNDFKNIRKGRSTSKDVKKIDPYLYIYEFSNNTGVSEHKLKDNKNLIIEYVKKNKSWVVSDIKYNDEDPSNMTKSILPEDLKLIQRD